MEKGYGHRYGDSISARDSEGWHESGVSASLLVCVSGQDGSVAKTDDRVDRSAIFGSTGKRSVTVML